MMKLLIFTLISYLFNAQQTDMQNFTNLPLSNIDYQYSYSTDTKIIIERDNNTGLELARFEDYSTFRDYYLKLNQRIVLPINLEDLYNSSKYLLSKNYINEESMIRSLNSNINYYLKIIDDNIIIDNLDNINYIKKIIANLSEEISYQGAEKFEIALIILIGEHFKTLNQNLEWKIMESKNILGEKFFYPELFDKNDEYSIYDNVRRVLYNEGDDKIFNFDYLFHKTD